VLVVRRRLVRLIEESERETERGVRDRVRELRPTVPAVSTRPADQ
jgi:hypothetical protein